MKATDSAGSMCGFASLPMRRNPQGAGDVCRQAGACELKAFWGSRHRGKDTARHKQALVAQPLQPR